MKSWFVGVKCIVMASFACGTSIFCPNLGVPFLNLVEKGSLDQVLEFVQQRYEDVNDTILDSCTQDLISTVDQDGKTSLHYAVQSGDRHKVQLLLRLCIQLLDQVDRAGKSPLVEAIELCSFPMVQLLLQHGARVNRGTQVGETPLAVFIRLHRQYDSDEFGLIAKSLDDYEAPLRVIPDELWDMGARDNSSTSSSDDLSGREFWGSSKEGLSRASSCPARLNDLVQPLKRIHRSPECNFIKVPVALPITPVMSDNSSFTMLEQVAAFKQALAGKKQNSLQQALLDKRYEDASRMIRTGERSLQWSHMVFVNTVDSNLGCLPLTHAVFMQDYNQVKYLLGFGASIDEIDYLGRTPRNVAFGLHACSETSQKINTLFEQLDSFDPGRNGLFESLLLEKYKQAFLLVQDDPLLWNQRYAIILDAPGDDGMTRLGRAIKSVNHDDMRCLVFLGIKVTDMDMKLASECGVLEPLLQYMRSKKSIHKSGEVADKTESQILTVACDESKVEN